MSDRLAIAPDFPQPEPRPLDQPLPDVLARLRRAAVGNAASPDGVTPAGVTRHDVPVAAVVTVAIAWTADVEIRAGAEAVKAAVFCRNAAERDVVMARELDAEAASMETARRIAALIGPPDRLFLEEAGELPSLPATRGPYYHHVACPACSGGGVRACAHDGCRGGRVDCPRCGGTGSREADGQTVRCEAGFDGGCGGVGTLRCPDCAGAGVVACDACDGAGHFTHLHRPRLTATASRGFAIPPDTPESVRRVLDEASFDRFGEVAGTGPAVMRHSGPHLVCERAGTVPVTTLSCLCDGVAFDVDMVGAEALTPDVPPFLDRVLGRLLSYLQAAPPGDAFAAAATFRATAPIADAILAGRAPDLDAIVAEHEGCVGRAFLSDAEAALRQAFETAGRGAARRVWAQGAVALAVLLPLVAAVDLPGLLTSAAAERPAPLGLRALWDIGVPVAAGLGVLAQARHRIRTALRVTLGGAGGRAAATGGSWPGLVLGSALALHLGLMAALHGGVAVDRGDPAPEAVAQAAGAPLPPPRALSPMERTAAGQRALARLGLYDGPIDGKPGDATKAGLAGLSGLADEAGAARFAGDSLGLAMALAADRVGLRLSTPDRLVGAGWSNATRLRLTQDDQPRIAQALAAALGAPGVAREWVSGDGARSGSVTVIGRVDDPQARQRPCVAFRHEVTTPAGRDPGVPAVACRMGGRWLLDE